MGIRCKRWFLGIESDGGPRQCSSAAVIGPEPQFVISTEVIL